MEKIARFVKPYITFQFASLSCYIERTKRSFLRLFRFLDYPHHSEHGALAFDNTEDYLYLPEIFSAKKHIYAESISLSVVVGIALLAFILGMQLFFGVSVLVILSASIAFFYFVFLVFKLWVVQRSSQYDFIDFTDSEIASIKDEDLPKYTVFIPLKYEAKVIPQIMQAMLAIDYPQDKLEFIIPLETYDTETIAAIKKYNPPSNFRIEMLPDVTPRTKPRTLNVIFPKATGEYFVIYDAEIIPDANQLKKAYLAFKKFPKLGSLQTRLEHYNANQNLLTKLFNAEFAFYYDLFLPGLQHLGYPIPLSGHSVHFRKSVVSEIGAWDPYNVTEDCDLGMRLYRKGYQTGILNSISLEEATSNLDSWIKQRTRWMKGFIQTSIVHLRHPLRFKKEIGGWENFCAFLLTVPGTVVLNLLNFLTWILQIVWLSTQAVFIQSLFPSIILYFSVASFVVGNFIFMYMNLVALYRRGRYHMLKYILLSPIYWIFLAIATMRAAIQIVVSPHTWEKTTHGDHLQKSIS